MRRLVCVISTLLVLVSLSGCSASKQTYRIDRAYAPLEPVPFSQVKDIPLPKGFSFLLESSWAYQDAEIRVGSFRFVGKSALPQVIDFYHHAMLQYGWVLVNSVEGPTSVLSFLQEGAGQKATIVIQAEGRNTFLLVSVQPIRSTGLEEFKSAEGFQASHPGGYQRTDDILVKERY